MAIPHPAGFQALVVANQANTTRTQQVPSLQRSCPVRLKPVGTLVVNVGAQPLYEQAMQEVAFWFARNEHNITEHLVELFVFLVVFEVFSMCSIVGCNGWSRVSGIAQL